MVGILVIGILLGWLFFGGSDTPASEHQHESSEGMETIWTCSMHPQIQMKEPGQCPLCGMDLIPLESNGSAIDPNALQMTEDAMKLANIQTMVVGGSKDTNKKLTLNGKVQIDERKLYTQSSHIPGRIEKLNLNFTGEKVNRGQTLAMVYSPELVTAQEELLQAYRIKETQPELFEAAKQKLNNWKIGAGTINKIISTNKPIQQFPITA
ncbi:MAG TPA: efflux RND transporter periplasmic adaptor subunit, partial [Flavobacteriaceae bacterium]